MASVSGIKRFNVFAPYRRILKAGKDIANKVDDLKLEYRAMDDRILSSKTDEFIKKLKDGQTIDSMLVEVLATVREAIFRVTGLFAYKVQLIGTYVLHIGDFAELYTGEGKTLVCVMAAYINALEKKGVHIITVNEYLVQRDAKFCAECLNPLGITVGYNLAAFDNNQKQKMFACDITYTTNSELGFDYLRDNMVKNYQDKVIRGLHYAIVDEGDSVLIDEARTPLIISGMPKPDVSLYVDADRFVKTLVNADYKIDPESNSISLVDSGVKKAEAFFQLKNYYLLGNSNLIHKIKNSLMANFVFLEGKEYIVKEDKILLIDQFTGRILEGRSYNAGLQQAIQAKEYVQIEPENVIIATITYQSFFRMYKKLAACSGTALTEEEEFMKIYNMVVVPVPTNKRVVRKDYSDYIFQNKVSKWHHVVAEVERIHQTNQPILIGTASVEDSEQLSTFLNNKGLKYELLNAKNNALEADIIKNAGEKGSITISTNMAGRGTDIKLGDGVVQLGGLYVIGTEHNESRRVDNQLRGRSGRQGDIGQTRFFVSLQDELFVRFVGKKLDKANEKIDEDYLDSRFWLTMINSAQKRIEGMNFDVRKSLIDYDSVLSNQRELIYKQRDEILIAKNNLQIILNMCKTVAKEIITNNVDPKNGVYVIGEQVASILNRLVFGAELVNHQFFTSKSINECEEQITNLLRMSINLKIDELGHEQSERMIKSILLQNLDLQWTNHLDLMTKIREGVSLRSLEQKSPLNIYIEEADNHFESLKLAVARNTVYSIHKFFVANATTALQKTLAKTNPGILTPDVLSSLLPKEVKVESKNEDVISNVTTVVTDIGGGSPHVVAAENTNAEKEKSMLGNVVDDIKKIFIRTEEEKSDLLDPTNPEDTNSNK